MSPSLHFLFLSFWRHSLALFPLFNSTCLPSTPPYLAASCTSFLSSFFLCIPSFFLPIFSSFSSIYLLHSTSSSVLHYFSSFFNPFYFSFHLSSSFPLPCTLIFPFLSLFLLPFAIPYISSSHFPTYCSPFSLTTLSSCTIHTYLSFPFPSCIIYLTPPPLSSSTSLPSSLSPSTQLLKGQLCPNVSIQSLISQAENIMFGESISQPLRGKCCQTPWVKMNLHQVSSF